MVTTRLEARNMPLQIVLKGCGHVFLGTAQADRWDFAAPRKGLHDDLDASHREDSPRNYAAGSATARFREALGRAKDVIHDARVTRDA